MSREVTLKLPQRKSAYEEALSDILEDEEMFDVGDRAMNLLRELLEALRLS